MTSPNLPMAAPYVAGLELSINRRELTLRAGRTDIYLRRRGPHDPRWSFLREPNNIEVFAFGLALTVSWGPWRSVAAQ